MGRQKGLAAIARHRVIIHLPGGGGRRGSRAWYIRTTPTTTAGAMHSKIDNVHRFREVRCVKAKGHVSGINSGLINILFIMYIYCSIFHPRDQCAAGFFADLFKGTIQRIFVIEDDHWKVLRYFAGFLSI